MDKHICPICRGELQAQGEALFKEHHKRLWEKKVAELGIATYDEYEECFGKLFYRPKANRPSMWGRAVADIPTNKPTELVKWEAENPVPDVDLVGFVVSLAKRFFGVMPEKGGSK